MMNNLPVAIIGGGPVGLAAVAHLLERGENPILFEAGERIGANVRDWGHVRMFSPWEYTVDSASVRLLDTHGWQMPPKDGLPTGNDLYNLYLCPFAELPEVRDVVQTGAKVVAISRRNIDKMKDKGRETAPFILHIEYSNGDEALIEARAVIDASGTWSQPNPIGANGLPAIGEKRHQDRIVYGIPDVTGDAKDRYANKRVMVVGSGHSAINALLELAKLKQDYPDTQALWVLRGTNLQKIYGGLDDDALEARGKLGEHVKATVDTGAIEIVAPFRIEKVESAGQSMLVTGEINGEQHTVSVDEIIACTGLRPDLDIVRELRLDLDPSLESPRTLGPMIDPNLHSCGTVPPHGEAELRQPEKDFYIVGMKSYGRAPTFLLATGYEQVRSVVAGLVGDWEAAKDVQLNLPETGVCSTDFADDVGSACCGTPAAEASPAVLSIGAIPIANNGAQVIKLQPTNTSIRTCCDDDCCPGDDNCC